jgi:hypothetical protein
MAANHSGTSRTLLRTVAPFAPLAIALAMNAVPRGAAGPGAAPAGAPAGAAAPAPSEITAVTCEEVADFQDCHTRYPAGCSAAAGYDPALNLLKNALIPPPGPDPIKYLARADFANLDAQVPSGLSAHNHADYESDLAKLGEGQIYGIVGYLYYAQHTGAESTNCQLTGPTSETNLQDDYTNVDFHIGIGFEPAPASAPGQHSLAQNSIIVEMTPYSRFLYENSAWTLANLKKAQDKLVRVVGQLMVDSEHNVPSQNCAVAKTTDQRNKCWRASVWELHPVVRFQVCPTTACTAESQDWVDLGKS